MTFRTDKIYSINMDARIPIVVAFIAFTLLIPSSKPFCQETTTGNATPFEFAVTLPTTIRCEKYEEIQFFSKLSQQAQWRIYPGDIAVRTVNGIKGQKDGKALLCGKDGNRIAVVPILVESLTPDEHSILEGLRKELSKSNLLRNHLRDADANMTNVRTKRNSLTSRFTDIDIEINRVSSGCASDYSTMQDTATEFRKARSEYEAAFNTYETSLSKIPEYRSVIGKLLLPQNKNLLNNTKYKIILPGGFRIGEFITPGSGLRIDSLTDWKEILRFEALNRPALSKETDKLYNALDRYEQAKNKLSTSTEHYSSEVMSIDSLLDEQDALPSKLRLAQRDFDNARKDKLSAMYEFKENERRVEELQLFYQFRKWIESRTVVGFVNSSDIFGIDTDPFKSRLTEYRAVLEDSLTAVDKKTSDIKSEPKVPDECVLPSQDLFHAFSTTSDEADAPAGTNFTKDTLVTTLLSYVKYVQSAECLIRCNFIDSSTGYNRSNPNMESQIPAGAIIDGDVTERAVALAELSSLNPFDIGDLSYSEFLVIDERESDNVSTDRHIPSIHILNADIARKRTANFTGYKSELEKYNNSRAAYDESRAAFEYKDSALKSLATTNAIDLYVDWRILYIRIVHGGETTRMIELDKLLKTLPSGKISQVKDPKDLLSLVETVTNQDISELLGSSNGAWSDAQRFLLH